MQERLEDTQALLSRGLQFHRSAVDPNSLTITPNTHRNPLIDQLAPKDLAQVLMFINPVVVGDQQRVTHFERTG